jgi:nicotinamidase-related amidase
MQGANVKGLILVDIQNDYFPGGNWELVGVEQAVKNAQKLLQKFRKEGSPIFHIQHISVEPEATFFLPDTEGAETHESVAPQPDEAVIVKNFPNSFRNTSLLNNLKDSEVEEVVICGAMSHMCIDATTRAAFDFGFQCIVIEDACATRDLEYKDRTVKAAEVHAAFMGALAEGYAKVTSINDFDRVPL